MPVSTPCYTDLAFSNAPPMHWAMPERITMSKQIAPLEIVKAIDIYVNRLEREAMLREGNRG
ncbi:MAG: hypothetical protein J5654_04920 [Victivallales bacterium]|nr:hypothetical protein [Victivallales bacterium]